MKGNIVVFTGSMFAGKTSELIRRLRRLRYAKKSFLLFKPEIDRRYSDDDVVSHTQDSLSSIPVKVASDIFLHWSLNPTDVVAIDEAQFFSTLDSPSISEIVRRLALSNVSVMVAGLDMDADGNPFGHMPNLMAMANEVIKLRACCAVCGEDANMTKRKHVSEQLVELGASDKYEARCLAHWTCEY
jgi:thymidine kinase